MTRVMRVARAMRVYIDSEFFLFLCDDIGFICLRFLLELCQCGVLFLIFICLYLYFICLLVEEIYFYTLLSLYVSA